MDVRPEVGNGPLPSLGAAFVWLVVAVGPWCLGGRWWASDFLGPLHWLGCVLELLGLIATVGAIGASKWGQEWVVADERGAALARAVL